MSTEKKVQYVKCKASASLIPNNFTSNESYVAYAHRNEVHIVKNDNAHLIADRASSRVAMYTEKGAISQVRYCKFKFGETLVVVSQTGAINVFEPDGQKLIASHQLANKTPKEQHLRGIASDGGKMLYVGSGTNEVLQFSVAGGKMSLEAKLAGHSEPVADIVCHKDGVVSGDESGSVIFWDNKGGKKAEWKGAGHPVTSLCAGHGYAVAGFSTGHIRMFRLDKCTIHAEVAAHTRTVNGVAMHPTKPVVGTCSEDTFVSVWSLPTKATAGVDNVLQISPSPFLITGVQFVGDKASYLACTAYDSRYISLITVP